MQMRPRYLTRERHYIRTASHDARCLWKAQDSSLWFSIAGNSTESPDINILVWLFVFLVLGRSCSFFFAFSCVPFPSFTTNYIELSFSLGIVIGCTCRSVICATYFVVQPSRVRLVVHNTELRRTRSFSYHTGPRWRLDPRTSKAMTKAAWTRHRSRIRSWLLGDMYDGRIIGNRYHMVISMLP